MAQNPNAGHSVPDLVPVEEFFAGVDALDSVLFDLPHEIPELPDITSVGPKVDVRELETPVGQTWFRISDTIKEHFDSVAAANHEFGPDVHDPVFVRAGYPNLSEPVSTIEVTLKPSGSIFVESMYFVGEMSWPYLMGSEEGLETPVLYAAAIAAGLTYSSIAVVSGQTQLSYHQGLASNSAIGDVHTRLEEIRDESEKSDSEQALDTILDLIKERPEWVL
ncbi:hypothetical protein EXE44_03305 [Halorubrum sp. SS7]|uniref:hypothetical protein n=1 Tax=unclassified Halorubrum TaxID=2642239 RepID=UPI0010F70D4F|nr:MULTISPECIES: hypothetical protein [unclassified Halorubrum]TKX52841.1 hypothetical protein EXE42_15240 [Halorubrum sp. SP3]TKX59478.1 hypothetical protein EXE44_03305 [Halorubrum sp. SS7]